MIEYIGALDQGTTSSKFVLVTHEGKIAHQLHRNHRQIFPQPGWVEHDPDEILGNCRSLLAEAADLLESEGGHLHSLGLTNQRETLVAWNRHTGRPYGNAIVWQDTRSAAICDSLASSYGIDRWRAQTGLPISTYFTGPKIRWLLDHIPGLKGDLTKQSVCFGTIDTWLAWNLCGEFVTDVTNASRTLLMNLTTLRWDEEILAELGIPATALPRICSSTAPFGTVAFGKREAALNAMLGDQQAALFGQTCFSPGQVKNTYGTGCFLLLNTGPAPIRSQAGLLTTLAYQLEGGEAAYALEGSVAVAGALVQWLRDNLGLISSSSEIETVARSVPDNGDVYIVPAFSGLFAPWWRSDARGTITGLTRFANKGHIARAALEATAFQTADVVQAMQKDAGITLSELRVDGGMTVNNLLLQFQADILGVNVIRPQIMETTALGAAFAAGLQAGFWDGFEDLRAAWRASQTWRPEMAAETRAHYLARWNLAVQKSMGWAQNG